VTSIPSAPGICQSSRIKSGCSSRKAQRGLAVTCGHDAKSVLLEGEREQTHDRRVVISDEDGMRTNLPRRLRGAGGWGRFGVPLDEPQFLPFGRGENIKVASSSAGAPPTPLDDAIDRFVVAERIMVSERQLLGARGDRVVDHPLGGRVAPAVFCAYSAIVY